jgi:hypothetical protein
MDNVAGNHLIAVMISIPIQICLNQRKSATTPIVKLWQQAEDLKKAGYYSKAIPLYRKGAHQDKKLELGWQKSRSG